MTTALQLPLFSVAPLMPPPPSAPRFRHVVEVNECGIFASRLGWDWWTENVLLRPIANRIDWLGLWPGGGIAHLPCEDKEEAEFVRGYMVAHGVHPKHVKVRRIRRECGAMPT
jgi:hypothetical protein